MRRIPLFDLRKFDANKIGFAKAVGKAFREYGFIRVVGHGIPDHLLNDAADNASAFFELPDDVKAGFWVKGAEGFSSYTKNFEQALGAKQVDLKEEWFVRARHPEGEPKTSRLRESYNVPQVPGFQKSVLNLYGAFEDATVKFMRVLALYMDLEENYFDDKFDRSNSSMRLLHYPTAGTAASHLDLNFLTWLRANKKGLYVTDRSGQEHAVVAKKGELILNGGMMLGLLTNDDMRPSWHRVEATEPRDTIVFFAHPNPDFFLSPLEAFKTAALGIKPGYFPADDKPITANEFLWEQIEKTKPKGAAPK
ncbi:MAG: 2OG-Fe(II) oxygenase superfamily protein [Micavibrio sp.]|nr:2OG-Fe(II) oxygenase superfamily protein [Micavibrio sp.]